MKVLDFIRDHPVIFTAIVAFAAGDLIGFLFRGQFC